MQVSLGIQCQGFDQNITIDPCNEQNQKKSLPEECSGQDDIVLTNSVAQTVWAVVRDNFVFAQRHPLNTSCTLDGCPFGMQTRPSTGDNAPFACFPCALPNFEETQQGYSATEGKKKYRYYVACPKKLGSTDIKDCPHEDTFEYIPGTEWLLPSKEDCTSVAYCKTGFFRSLAGNCVQCPHGAVRDERGRLFAHTCKCPPGTESGEDACIVCEPGTFQNESTNNVSCQACSAAVQYGASSCDDSAWCSGLLRSDGVCLTRPATVAAVFSLVSSGQVAWSNAASPPDPGALQLRENPGTVYTADDLVTVGAACSPNAVRDPTGQCAVCPAGERGDSGGCTPVPCQGGDVEPENRTCHVDASYKEIIEHNVSHFCYPVRTNASSPPTTCEPCTLGNRTEAGRYMGALNTLEELWPAPPGPSPCKYRCEPGFEERVKGEGCWPCLPGFAGVGCVPCPPGTHSSRFNASTACVGCAAGTFSLGQQHACTPCVVDPVPFKVWRAKANLSCTIIQPSVEQAILINSSTALDSSHVSGVCASGVTFVTDNISRCHPDTERVFGRCAPNATSPNCLPTARLASVSSDREPCNTNHEYASDAGGCANCSNHTCASPDAYLVPRSCPPVCRSCLENATDGEDVAASTEGRVGHEACVLFCTEDFVPVDVLPTDLQPALAGRRCAQVLPGPDLRRVSNGQLRCDPAQGSKLQTRDNRVVFCERPMHDCARRNARPRPGSQQCECLSDFYAADAAVSHCLQCPSDRTSAPGARSREDCVCRLGFFAPSEQPQGECTVCPSNSTFFCPGNTTQVPCAANSHTTSTGAFASHHCAPDFGFVRENDQVRSCDLTAEGRALSIYVRQRGPCARTCSAGSSFVAGRGCRCSEAQGFAFYDAGRECRCGPGFWRRNATACEPCPRGSYCPGFGVERQTECPDVLQTTEVGATQLENCTCAPGYYLPIDNPATCLPCPTLHICFDNMKYSCFELDGSDGFRKSVHCDLRRQSKPQVCPPGSEYGNNHDLCTNYDKHRHDFTNKILTNMRGTGGSILAYEKVDDFLEYAFAENIYTPVSVSYIERNQLTSRFGSVLSYTTAARLQLVCGNWALVPRAGVLQDAAMFSSPDEPRLECFNTSALGIPGPRVQVSSGLAFLGPGGLADLSRSRDDQAYRSVGAHLPWNLVVTCAETAWLSGCPSSCGHTPRLTHDAAHSFHAWTPVQQVAVLALDPPAQHVWAEHELPWVRVPVDQCEEKIEAPVLARVLRRTPRVTRRLLAETLDGDVLAGLHAKVCVRVDTVWWQPAGWGAHGVTFARAGPQRPPMLDPAREGVAPLLRAALAAQVREFSWEELRTLQNDVVRGGYVRAQGQSADYYVREDRAAAVVPRHAVAMLSGYGELNWRLLGDRGEVVQRLDVATLAQTFVATVASTWAWKTTPETLPALLALTCTDGVKAELVVCQPVTQTCQTTPVADDAGSLCSDARLARVLTHHLPLNFLYMMTPRALWAINLTDFAALPTATPVLSAQPLLSSQTWTSFHLVAPWDHAKGDDEHACGYAWQNFSLGVYRGPEQRLAVALLDPVALQQLVSTTLATRHHMERDGWVLDVVDHLVAAPTVAKCTDSVRVLILCRAQGTTLYVMVQVHADFGTEHIAPQTVLGMRVLSPQADPGSVRWSVHARPAVQPADVPVNLLTTALHLELTYLTRQTLHVERFRSTCDACFGGELEGINGTCVCPAGTTRACLPCGEFCAAQTLTWKSQTSACAVPSGLQDGQQAYTTCLPCAGRGFCPEPSQPTACDPGRYVLDTRATTAAVCACPVNQTTMPRMRRFLHNTSRMVTYPAGIAQDGQCVACDPEVELCHPLLGPGQSLVCPPGTFRTVYETRKAPFETQITLHCVCPDDTTEESRVLRVDSMDRGPRAVQEARTMNWTGAAQGLTALLERASFVVRVDTCRRSTPSVRQCSAGQYEENGTKCDACPQNFFCPGAGPKPIPCPHGQTTTRTGGKSIEECKCAEGTFREPGAPCEACPVGHKCTSGLDSEQCPEGQVSSEDKTSCECPPDTEKNEDTESCDKKTNCDADYLRVNQDLQSAKDLLLERAHGLKHHALAVPDKAVLLQYQAVQATDTHKCWPCPPVLTCTGSSPPIDDSDAPPCALSAAGCANKGTLWSAPTPSRAWALAWPSVVRIDTRQGPSAVLGFVTQYNKTFFAQMAWAGVPEVVEIDTEPGVFEVFAEIQVSMLDSAAWESDSASDLLENATRVSRAWFSRAQKVLQMDARARAVLLAGRLLWNAQLERALVHRNPGVDLAFLGDDTPVREALGGSLYYAHVPTCVTTCPVLVHSPGQLVLRAHEQTAAGNLGTSRVLSGTLTPSVGACPLGTRAASAPPGLRACAVCEPVNDVACWQCGGLNALEACDDVVEEMVAVQCTEQGDVRCVRSGDALLG